MSEERRDQPQEEARRVLSPVRVAVLLLLGASFLVLGGARAEAAEAEPASEEDPHLVTGTLAAVGADEGLTVVGATVDGLVDPVVAATEPVVDPVVEPVVAPVVTPLQPVVERVVPPPVELPVDELLAPAPAPAAGADRVEPSAPRVTTEARGDATVSGESPAVDDQRASLATSRSGSGTPVHGTPVSRSTAASSDGGAGAPVPYAVLLTALAAVLLLAGGVAPRRVAPPLAPTFLPPVFPG